MGRQDPFLWSFRTTARTITCACCADRLDPEDFRPDLFDADHAEAMESHFHGPVCTSCMDAHVVCADTGRVMLADCADRDSWGGFVDPDGYRDEIEFSTRTIGRTM